MKKTFLIVNLLIAMIMGGNVWAEETPSANNQAVSILFVQSAKHAAIDAIPNQPGAYRLTLDRVSPYVIYFSERPNRITGLMPNTKFAAEWKVGSNSFAKDSPNAYITSYDGKQIHYTVELTDLTYNKAKNRFTYIIRMLPEEKATLPNHVNLGYTTMFVDGFCLSCIG